MYQSRSMITVPGPLSAALMIMIMSVRRRSCLRASRSGVVRRVPSLRTIPGHLTRVTLRTEGNLTQNEARPVGHLTFVSKRLSAVGSKRISQFFDSAREPRSTIALVDSTWVFLLLSCYIVISWNMLLFKVWSEDKLNKKFVVTEHFAELVSTVALACLEGGGFYPL